VTSKGSWIVTADELLDPQSLEIACDVSGETLHFGLIQSGRRRSTIAKVAASHARPKEPKAAISVMT
jgi:2-keto-4-pentenoate hydratase/2-oxohepta-3-ene-1,7-dioic acid hydratase in catechol pathway